MDDNYIYVVLPVGGELKIAYTYEENIFDLTEEGFLTLEEIEADLQGYWIHTSTLDLGRNYSSEEIFYFKDGEVKHEKASEALFGGYGDYYYYGPYKGTYTLDENGLTIMSDGGNEIRNGIKYVMSANFGIIDGKAVYMELNDVYTPTDSFKGRKGFVFKYFD